MTFPESVNALICDECSTTTVGEFRVVIVLGDKTEIRTNAIICDACRDVATVGDYLTDDQWASIVDVYVERKKTVPRRIDSTLKFIAATSGADSTDASDLIKSSADGALTSKGGP